jgi:hypothetical protein
MPKDQLDHRKSPLDELGGDSDMAAATKAAEEEEDDDSDDEEVLEVSVCNKIMNFINDRYNQTPGFLPIEVLFGRAIKIGEVHHLLTRDMKEVFDVNRDRNVQNRRINMRYIASDSSVPQAQFYSITVSNTGKVTPVLKSGHFGNTAKKKADERMEMPPSGAALLMGMQAVQAAQTTTKTAAAATSTFATLAPPAAAPSAAAAMVGTTSAPAVNPTPSPNPFYEAFKQHLNTVGLEISYQSYVNIPKGLLDLIKPLLTQGMEGKKWVVKIISASKVIQLCRTDLITAQLRPYKIEYDSNGTIIPSNSNLQQGQQNLSSLANANSGAAMVDVASSAPPTAAAVAAAYAAATAAQLPAATVVSAAAPAAITTTAAAGSANNAGSSSNSKRNGNRKRR